MILKEYKDTLAYDTAFWMAGLYDSDYPLEQLGSLSLEVSDKLRVLAIIGLLTKGDNDLMCHNLIRSGNARVVFLKRLKLAKVEIDHHMCSGRYEPLLDSIAAGNFELAQQISAMSPSEWLKDHEYEDDYCYAQIIQRLIQAEISQNDIFPFLIQFKDYLNDEENARFDICKALINYDQVAFEEAFENLLDERELLIMKDKEEGQMEDPLIIAKRHIFIEGLALLRVAKKHGLLIQSEYRYCPSIALMPMKKPFPGE